MTNEFLFKKVNCKAYLKPKKRKYCISNDIDETIEENDVIKLGYGDSVTQDKYELVHKKFSGVCCGIYEVYTKRKYIQDYNDEGRFDYVYTEDEEPVEICRVYYANNKSRLAPIEFISDLLEE